MTVRSSVFSFLTVILVFSAATSAQKANLTPTSGRIRLYVVVDTKSGRPAAQLTRQNLSVLDNRMLRTIASFRIVTSADEPVKVIIVLDAVSAPYTLVAISRQEIEKYLKTTEGQLAEPTSIAVLTDQGLQIDNAFSTNGNALSDALEHYTIGLRQVTRDSQWAGIDMLDMGTKALNQLTQIAASIPGRKIVLWVSPGWPLLSGPDIQLTGRQQTQIFNQVVGVSTHLSRSDVTLYNINPIGVSESLLRADYYEDFLKGLARTTDAQFGNLGLQVFAVHSGGLALESNSDLVDQIQRCLVDTRSWYEISFDPAPADKPNEYHHLEVKVDQPGFVARTQDGYYANPTPLPLR